jgi:hypothetical protein
MHCYMLQNRYEIKIVTNLKNHKTRIFMFKWYIYIHQTLEGD